MAEGIVLAGLINNPEGNDGKGSPFDPTVNANGPGTASTPSSARCIELKFVKPRTTPTRRSPTRRRCSRPAEARANAVNLQGRMDKPEGLIVHHVLGEVAALTDPKTGRAAVRGDGPDGSKHFDRIRNGGLKIVTTIDQNVQQIAVREATRNPESNMDNKPGNLQAALVAVEPGTGAVKAYYGGDSGNGGDFAGSYRDPVLSNGEDRCCGGHPSGATIPALHPRDRPDGRLLDRLVLERRVAAAVPGQRPDRQEPGQATPARATRPRRSAVRAPRSGAPWKRSTVMSLNTPFFALAEKVGPAKVIDTARAAGITEMWADGRRQVQEDRPDAANKGADVFPKYFNTEVAFGQYPVTVLDHAGGIATFAARGVAAKTHFLKEVWEDGKKTYGEVINPKRIPGFTDQMADDLNAVLQGVPQHYSLKLKDGRPIAGAAGAWQLGQATADNAHAWMVGYTAYDPANKSHRPGDRGLGRQQGRGAEDRRQERQGHHRRYPARHRSGATSSTTPSPRSTCRRPPSPRGRPPATRRLGTGVSPAP